MLIALGLRTVLVWDGAAAYREASPKTNETTKQKGRTSPATPQMSLPMLAYEAPQEVNSVAWGGSASLGSSEWLAFSAGRTVQLLQV